MVQIKIITTIHLIYVSKYLTNAMFAILNDNTFNAA